MAVDTGVGARREDDLDKELEVGFDGEIGSLPVLPEVQRDETRAGLHRAVWRLAWPSVLTMLLQTFNSFLDRFFVGHLGSDALAAVGVGGQFMFLLMSVGMSIAVGTSALVSRFTGAQEPDQAKMAANQSLWVGVIAAVVCASLVWPLRHLVVGWMGVNAHAADLCVRYLSLTLLGVPALFVMLILSSVFRGLGDTVTPLRVMIGVNIIHLGGDYLLIFGNWGFPKMGLVGGAAALITSQVVGAALYFWFLQRSPLRGFGTRLKRLEMDWAKRILNIGLPAVGAERVAGAVHDGFYGGAGAFPAGDGGGGGADHRADVGEHCVHAGLRVFDGGGDTDRAELGGRQPAAGRAGGVGFASAGLRRDDCHGRSLFCPGPAFRAYLHA